MVRGLGLRGQSNGTHTDEEWRLMATMRRHEIQRRAETGQGPMNFMLQCSIQETHPSLGQTAIKTCVGVAT